jgi:hypothetical protein
MKSFQDWRFDSDILICEGLLNEDQEFSMARGELTSIKNAISRLMKKLKGEGNLEAWVQSKITKAADYITTVADHMESGEDDTEKDDEDEMEESWSTKYKKSIDCNNPKGFSQRAHCQGRKKKEISEACWKGYVQKGLKKKGKKLVPNCVPVNEANKSGDDSLRDWFTKSRSSDGTPGWVQLGGKYAGKPCAKQPGQTTKPKCGSSKMKADLSHKEEERAFRRKNQEDPNPDRKGKAKMVATEEKDACYKKVKSRYSVWPSAYASGALVKCRKVGAANWGNKSKKKDVKEAYTRIQERGATYSIMLNWRGRIINTQMFFPKFTRPTKEEVVREVRKVYPNCVVLYFSPSYKDPTKPLLFAGEPNGSQLK